jgi:hypothetical protein
MFEMVIKNINRDTSGAGRSSNLRDPDLGPRQLTSLCGRSWLGGELGGCRGLGPLPSRRRRGLLSRCRGGGYQLRGVVVVVSAEEFERVEGGHFGGAGEDE